MTFFNYNKYGNRIDLLNYVCTVLTIKLKLLEISNAQSIQEDQSFKTLVFMQRCYLNCIDGMSYIRSDYTDLTNS